MDLKKINKEGIGAYVNLEKHGLDNFHLKMIAIITMLIDHIGALLLTGVPQEIFRAIGRISFPIFSFLIVEGYFHTSNKIKYAERLVVFAIISEIPYDLAFNDSLFSIKGQNIFFTLAIGLLMIWAMDSVSMGKIKYSDRLLKIFSFGLLQQLAKIIIVAIACFTAFIVQCSYSYAGVFLILCYYAFYKDHIGKALCNGFFNIFIYGGLQSFGTFSVIPIGLYNNKVGRKKYKWVFYIFYPLHLTVLYIISKII